MAQILESADGTIRVIELDPTKTHWLIIDEGAMDPEQIAQIQMRDGTVLIKRPGYHVQIVEGGEDGAEVVTD